MEIKSLNLNIGEVESVSLISSFNGSSFIKWDLLPIKFNAEEWKIVVV
jgi:hypothetical protein